MRTIATLLVLAGALAACSNSTAAPRTGASAVAGVWDWTEHFDDATDGVTCDDTGSYVFVASGTGFSGRSDQVGRCTGPSGAFDNTSGDTVFDGSVSGGKMQFTVGLGGGCQYNATLTSTPDHLSGTATCGPATGSWTADRGLTVTSVAIVPESATVPVNAVMPLVLALRNSHGNRAFSRPVTWASDNPGVVPVDSLGRVSALGPGTGHVQGTVAGLSDRATITVGGVLVADAAADTFGVGPSAQMDLIALSAAADSAYLTVVLRLSKAPATALLAFVDLDVDQNGATGAQALVDALRPDTLTASGLGDEFVGDMVSGDLFNAITGSLVAVGSVFFDAATNTLLVRYPVAVLGTQADMAVVIGNASEPTDIAPNDGHLSLSGAVASVVLPGATALPRSPLRWGGTTRLSAPSRPRRGKLP